LPTKFELHRKSRKNFKKKKGGGRGRKIEICVEKLRSWGSRGGGHGLEKKDQIKRMREKTRGEKGKFRGYPTYLLGRGKTETLSWVSMRRKIGGGEGNPQGGVA